MSTTGVFIINIGTLPPKITVECVKIERQTEFRFNMHKDSRTVIKRKRKSRTIKSARIRYVKRSADVMILTPIAYDKWLAIKYFIFFKKLYKLKVN